jgi:hypothetical protein
MMMMLTLTQASSSALSDPTRNFGQWMGKSSMKNYTKNCTKNWVGTI